MWPPRSVQGRTARAGSGQVGLRTAAGGGGRRREPGPKLRSPASRCCAPRLARFRTQCLMAVCKGAAPGAGQMIAACVGSTEPTGGGALAGALLRRFQADQAHVASLGFQVGTAHLTSAMTSDPTQCRSARQRVGVGAAPRQRGMRSVRCNGTAVLPLLHLSLDGQVAGCNQAGDLGGDRYWVENE